MKKIEDDALYDRIVKMFFVDNDYDESLNGKSPNLYETPCYSIENLYARKEVFQDIIQAEFGINQAHEDYKRCIDDYEKRYVEFVQGMEEFNALVYLRRKKSVSNSNVKFGSVKTSHLFNISIRQIVKSSHYTEEIEKIKKALDVTDSEMINSIKDLKMLGDPAKKYRGKNQLDFFCSLLKQLKDYNNMGEYFSIKHNCVKLNITGNRLSELSQYALTPESLKDFLHNHQRALGSDQASS